MIKLINAIKILWEEKIRGIDVYADAYGNRGTAEDFGLYPLKRIRRGDYREWIKSHRL